LKLRYTVKTGFYFDQTSLELGLGKLFTARENLVSDIPAGDGNIAKPFLQLQMSQTNSVSHKITEKFTSGSAGQE